MVSDIKRVLRRVSDLASRSVQLRSPAAAVALTRDIHAATSPLALGPGTVRSERYGVAIDPRADRLFIRSMRSVDLLVGAGFAFTYDTAHGFAFSRGKLKFTAHRFGEVEVAAEIFGRQVYDLRIPAPDHVIDVGANLGYAALYFAERFDAPVTGYELFPSTAVLARANIDASGMAERVEIVAAGLADADTELEIAMDPDYRGGNGLYDYDSMGLLHKSVPERVQVLSAEVALRRVPAAASRILLKLDCEGAEHAIVRRLAETGDLRRVSAIVMEAHEFTPEHSTAETLDRLAAEGFAAHRTPQDDPRFSFVFAVRTQS